MLLMILPAIIFQHAALSLRLRSWLELIDLAFSSLSSLIPAEQPDKGEAECIGLHRLFAGKL